MDTKLISTLILFRHQTKCWKRRWRQPWQLGTGTWTRRAHTRTRPPWVALFATGSATTPPGERSSLWLPSSRLEVNITSTRHVSIKRRELGGVFIHLDLRGIPFRQPADASGCRGNAYGSRRRPHPP